MKIFLIGLPGSGKSTLGKQLANALHLPFIDLDSEIEKECESPIAEIFKIEGEAWFREKEAQVLRDRTKEYQTFVMATGGGAPCFYEGIDFMNQIGVTIFLDVPVAVITDRIIKEGKETRPLLAREDAEVDSVISKLYTQRLACYSKAMHRVRDSNISVNTLLDLIRASRIKS